LGKDVIDGLKKGGKSCTSKVMYPYANTVFPGGLLPPPIMFEGGADAAYVEVHYDSIDTVKYEFAAKSTGELTIPVKDWAEITRRSQNTVLLVKLNVKKGSAYSSCQLEWRVAPGNMIGAVYYNTYNAPNNGGVGAVMRLTLGKAKAEVYSTSPAGAAPTGPCRSCHSVSANGSTLVSSEHLYFPFGNNFSVSSYKVTPKVQPPVMSALKDATFAALTPDGTKLLQMGNPQCTAGASTFPRAPNNFMLAIGPSDAALINTANGQAIASTGLDKKNFMWMPQFSPDGKKVVFNHAKTVSGSTDRFELATMDFDNKTNTFSNLKVIVKKDTAGITFSNYAPGPPLGGIGGGVDPGGLSCSPVLSGDDALAHIPNGSCSGPCYPAWPFFTPDGNGVIYSKISEPDFAVAFPGRDKAAKSELWYVDLTTGEKVKLANANKGMEGERTDINYYPTVLPIQVGGYYWLVWTSMRKWGTRSTEGDPAEVTALAVTFGESAGEAFKKRLWVSAIKPRLQSGGEFETDKLEDPSFPPFYLDGQSATGNTRGFAALNPCKKTGGDDSKCTSGIDCCSGYCKVEKGATEGLCVEEVTCSDVNGKCETDKDCCAPEKGDPYQCIANYCGFVIQ